MTDPHHIESLPALLALMALAPLPPPGSRTVPLALPPFAFADGDASDARCIDAPALCGTALRSAEIRRVKYCGRLIGAMRQSGVVAQ